MKEQCRTAKQFLPKVLTAPTKINIRPVTKVTARATVDILFSMSTICPELFVEHGEEEYYSIIK